MDPTTNRTTHEEDSPEESDLAFNHRGCCCIFFVFPRSRRRNSNWWGRIQESDHRGFLSGELLAGPRWKNFIRRCSKNSRHLGAKLQYDPLSYALNFDENPDEGFRDFSSRFAAPCARV